MDDTNPSPPPSLTAPSPAAPDALDRLREVDPAEAPAVADLLAAELSEELDELSPPAAGSDDARRP